MTNPAIAAQAEELAKSIWNDRNICDYTELDTFLALTIPTIEAALTAAAAPPEGMVMVPRETYTYCLNLALIRVAMLNLSRTIPYDHDKRITDAFEILKEVEQAVLVAAEAPQEPE